MSTHTLEMTQAEARTLALAAFVGLKGSRAIDCPAETRAVLNDKLAALLSEVLSGKP